MSKKKIQEQIDNGIAADEKLKSEGKSPLQQAKNDKISQILNDKEAEPKHKKPRKSYKKKKVYDESQIQKDSEFIVALLNEIRTNAGLPVIKSTHEMFLKSSTYAMLEKYGDSVSRWMPEIVFGGSIAFIALDTVREMKILKLQTVVKAAVKAGNENEKPIKDEPVKK